MGGGHVVSRGDKRNEYTVLRRSLIEGGHMEDLRVDRSIILKYILKKQGRTPCNIII